MASSLSGSDGVSWLTNSWILFLTAAADAFSVESDWLFRDTLKNDFSGKHPIGVSIIMPDVTRLTVLSCILTALATSLRRRGFKCVGPLSKKAVCCLIISALIISVVLLRCSIARLSHRAEESAFALNSSASFSLILRFSSSAYFSSITMPGKVERLRSTTQLPSFLNTTRSGAWIISLLSSNFIPGFGSKLRTVSSMSRNSVSVHLHLRCNTSSLPWASNSRWFKKTSNWGVIFCCSRACKRKHSLRSRAKIPVGSKDWRFCKIGIKSSISRPFSSAISSRGFPSHPLGSIWLAST